MITAGDRGYAAWRDGGFTIHDISNPAAPQLLSHMNWSPPFPGGTHTPLPLPGRNLAIVADESNADNVRRGYFIPGCWMSGHRTPGADRHAADADGSRLLPSGQFRAAQSA